MKENMEIPFPFKIKKAKCKNCKQAIDIEKEDFFYCGCKNHLICYHRLCHKMVLGKGLDHRG